MPTAVVDDARYEPVVLAVLAILFWLVNAVAIAAVNAKLSVLGLGSSSGTLVAAGVALVLFALFESVTLVAYLQVPANGRFAGTVTIVLSGLSLFVGGGLLVGSIFGMIAGLLLILLTPVLKGGANDAERIYEYGVAPLDSSSPSTTTAAPHTTSGNNEGVVRVCLNCDYGNPVSSTTCQKCGASLATPVSAPR